MASDAVRSRLRAPAGATTRAVAAIVMATSVTVLSGCFQLPGSTPVDAGSQQPQGSDGPEQVDPSTEQGAVELMGTSWSGADDAHDIEMSLTLESDGTVLFDSWNGEHYDAPTDTWAQSGPTFTMYVSNIGDIGGITYTGDASLGTMELQGTDDLGDDGYDLVLTQS